jgi:hypothetical protein
MRIRDPGWKEFGSGIRDKHFGFATQLKLVLLSYYSSVSGIPKALKS